MRKVSVQRKEQTWYKDGSKIVLMLEYSPKTLIFSLIYAIGKYNSVFAYCKIYAILQCARRKNRRTTENEQIKIISDRQVAFKARSNCIDERRSEKTHRHLSTKSDIFYF